MIQGDVSPTSIYANLDAGEKKQITFIKMLMAPSLGTPKIR